MSEADDYLEQIETPPAGPAPSVPPLVPLPWPGLHPAEPAPVAHPGHWVVHIPRPTMPSRRTWFEIVLVFIILTLIFRPWESLDGFPSPVPGPRVITGPLEARLIHDLDRDGFATAPIKADAELAPRLKKLDCGWGWMETTDTNAASLLGGHPSPAVAVYRRGATQPVQVLERPQSGDEVVSAVKAFRGKKD